MQNTIRPAIVLFFLFLMLEGCKKTDTTPPPSPPAPPSNFSAKSSIVTPAFSNGTYYAANNQPLILINFGAPLNKTTVTSNISLKSKSGTTVATTVTYQNGDSTVAVKPSSALEALTEYIISASTGLKSTGGGSLGSAYTFNFKTGIDSSDKFPRISDGALLDLVQQQTFKYFWDFGHPVSGMARERNTSGDVATTGGTGFGVMSMLAAINRGFISKADGLQRISTIADFLKTKCTRYHGAFAHWVDGSTGATVPFSNTDNGGDLVETSLLMQGLLCARQYFSGSAANEVSLRATINELWNGVEWNWYRQGGQNVLYWHWSLDFNFQINQKITGWNEALIVYVLAASSNTDSIPATAYREGWASNGGMKNGASYYGIQLPLGPSLGGPLFFAHYSFLGIKPADLSDSYAAYNTQNVNHSLINFNYCVDNPKNFYGYSKLCWGLTASDDNQSGYKAHSPTNDDGVITPTAAISSLPYTPAESMDAIKFFYYTLGDKLWKQYGFTDAFNLNDLWFADSFLAIDQGPEIVMIENYRSGLLWDLFMSCPEIKRGMKQLGFQGPGL
jgi:hypothetical protein